MHCPALGQRLRPDVLVKEFDGPGGGRLPFRRREIREVERPVLREVRIEQHVVQPLGGDRLHIRHAGDWRRDHAIGPDDAHRPGVLRDQKIAIR
jgi:hypothetical protein